jgi:cellulose synthase/poly-beta-1,6-N-acetylglucosamine synthase-like glycosyltransferase
LLGQTRIPDEIIIVDGGSTDGTWGILQRVAREVSPLLQTIPRPGCNISQGRNVAIAAARSEIIAATDAGVRLGQDWLEHLVAPFEGANPPDVVSGFFVADPRSPFELALGAVTLPSVQEIDPARFNPSSRSVAFRRAAWQAVGGYPEWLDYCEDLLFDFALRDAGFQFTFAPRALVHFRPRSNLRAFFRQYYRYARGDGKADFWLYRHLVRYGTYALALILLTLTIWHHPLWALTLVAGLAAMLHKPFQRAWPELETRPWRERLTVWAWLPLIRVTGDIAKMLGYPVGICWHWRHAPKTPWPKKKL